MRKLTMPQFLAVCFITILVNMNINSYMQLKALDNIANLINDSKQQQQEQQVIYSMAYEEPEEEIVVPVVYEKEVSGSSFYTFGNITDKFYLTIMINEEQGLYIYDAPNICENRIYCDSLAELEEWIVCHLDQAWPNATFAMEWR